MKFQNDPIGAALHDFVSNPSDIVIKVKSVQSDDDVLPVAYLFRTPEMMPEIEIKALELCRGKILDIGAGAGCHSIILQKRQFDVISIDSSAGAVELMKKAGLHAIHDQVENINDQKFDTLLLLMNGLGLARTIEQLPHFLTHLKSLLNPSGQILADTSDLSYLYIDEDGGMDIDLNSNYYGEMDFEMEYKDQCSGWFKWLYIDLDNLTAIAESCGLNCELILSGENNHYLVQLTLKDEI